MIIIALNILLGTPLLVAAPTGRAVQDRIDADLALDRPIVIHVVVALCDNEFQGIVPVPKALGDGQNVETNLYWGAAFGVRTFLSKRTGWSVVSRGPGAGPVLERIVLTKQVARGKRQAPVYIVADAWNGYFIHDATVRFLSMAAGGAPERISIKGSSQSLRAGGESHLVAFVGHDGLMDFSLSSVPSQNSKAGARSSIVLACASKPYFEGHLATGGSHQLLLTTNLMAPEAYTLDAAATAFAQGFDSAAIREAAASAYSRYQKCSLKAARGLFSTTP